MQICCICVLPFLILAIAKGFLLRLIKERVDPYKDWGPFLISCGIYQTCQSLEKGSLSRRSLIGLLITSIKPEKCLQIPIVSMPRPMIWLFFPFIEFPIIITSLLPVFSFFLEPHWDMKTYLENGKKKVLILKVPFIEKFLHVWKRVSLPFKIEFDKKDREESSLLIVPKHPLGNQLNKKVVVWMTSQLYKWWKKLEKSGP